MRGQVLTISVPASGRRGLRALPCSVAAHAAVVAALLCIPLLSDGELPEPMRDARSVFFVQPASVPLPPPPPAPSGGRLVTSPPQRPETDDRRLVVPGQIPEELPEEDTAALFGLGSGDTNGVVGGDPNGVAVGIVGGLPQQVAQEQVAPVRVGGTVKPPAKLHDVAPEYPELARRIGVQGDVVLECIITREGRVSSITVISGNPLLVEAARAAAAQWIYSPTLLNGVPVPVLLRATTRFRL